MNASIRRVQAKGWNPKANTTEMLIDHVTDTWNALSTTKAKDRGRAVGCCSSL